MKNSYEIVKLYRDVPPTTEETKKFAGKITKECQYYLMGKICLHERSKEEHKNETVEWIYAQIGKDFNYAEGSMRRFVTFTRAIDRLQGIAPEIIPDIIEGNVRLSIENTLTLSKKQRDEILNIVEQLSDSSLPVNRIFPEHPSHRPGIRKHKKKKIQAQEENLTSVKDSPGYDPDAQTLSLTYTIPSWIGAIDNVFMATDFSVISSKTRYKFRKELRSLIDTAEIILDMIKEKANG